MNKRLAILICTMFSLPVQADVPYTFTSGTPARASEVNQNFRAIDERISTLEEASGSGENCSNTISWWTRKHEITYQPTASTLGQALNYNGEIYRIVEVPFKEFSTGDLYKVRFPAKEFTAGQILANISTEHVSNAINCNQFYISGFPAFGKEATERRTISIYNNGTTESNSNLDIYYGISIKIGETNLSITLSVGKKENNVLVGIGDFDFTNDFDVNTMTHDQTLLSTINSLVGYIQVSKVQ